MGADEANDPRLAVSADGGTDGAITNDAGGEADRTLAEAVAARARVMCTRTIACGELGWERTWSSLDRCIEAHTTTYLDVVRAKGSTATVGSIDRCTTAYQAASCRELVDPAWLVGLFVDGVCAERGTLADGEPCFDGAHCKSGNCNHVWLGCGRCVHTAGPREACGPKVGDCVAHHRCVGGWCEPMRKVGESCDDSYTFCDAFLECVDGRCVRQAREGEACDRVACEDPIDLSCISGICRRRAVRRSGELCSLDDACVAHTACLLDEALGKRACAPKPAEGEACTNVWDCEPFASCTAGTCVRYATPVCHG